MDDKMSYVIFSFYGESLKRLRLFQYKKKYI